MQTITKNNKDVMLQSNTNSIVTHQEPVLSIIVPIYNAEKYLSQCLDSILAQQFSNFEALCVDDGSTDRTPQILDNYARVDSRIKAFHIKNQGVSHARNFALERAIGNYVGFVDSDDWIESDHFLILMKCFNDPTVDLGVSKVVFERTDSNYDGRSQIDSREYTPKELTRKDTFDVTFFDQEVLGFCPCRVFKRKNISDFFNEKITYAEDLLFCCQYAFKIKKAIYTNCQTYHYRYFEDSNASRLLKNLGRISGLDAELLIVEFLSQDVGLSRYRDSAVYSLINMYSTLVSHYKQANNKEVLLTLNGYRSEVYKYLRLYWTSSNNKFTKKLGATLKVCLPMLGTWLCKFSKILKHK